MTNMEKLRGIIEDTLREERHTLEKRWRFKSRLPGEKERLEGWIEALDYVLHQIKDLEG